MEKLKSTKVDWKKIAVVGALVFLTAVTVGGLTWYVVTAGAQDEMEAYKNDIVRLETEIKQLQEEETAVEEETIKETPSVTSNKFFDMNVPTPSGWSTLVNSKLSFDGSNYVGMNIFSTTNLILKNDIKKYSIGFNDGDTIEGRGGSCAKRSVQYKLTVVGKKISFTKTTDSINSETGPGEYCSGATLKGYVISANEVTYNGHKYFIHSEENTVTDDISADAVANFEKVLSSITFS